jgi:hypothetical protein
VVRIITAEVPAYRLLPADALRDDVVPIVRRNLQAFAAALDNGGQPGEDLIADVEASAARRAEEGFPLDAVLAAYHIGAREAWTVVARRLVEEGRAERLQEVGQALVGYMGAVTATVASVYLERHGHIVAAERDLRRILAQQVLAGSTDPTSFAELGLESPDEYGVLAVSFDSPSSPGSPGLTRLVAGRRLVRRVETALPDIAGPGTLHLLDATGGLVLVDARDQPGWPARCDELAASLAAEAGVPAWFVPAGPCRVAETQAAYEQARAVLDLARRLGRPPGLHRREDLLLEAMADSHRSTLVDLLSPLEGSDDLLATLEAWFDNDRDRQRTARALFVHPNTLDYRLRQIADRTGLDPRTGRGAALLLAACIARKLVR